MAVSVELALELGQFIARGEEDKRAILVARKDGQADAIPFLFEQRSAHLNPQDQRRIDRIRTTTLALGGYGLIELLPQTIAMPAWIALGRRPAAPILATGQALGQPQQLQVIITRHAAGIRRSCGRLCADDDVHRQSREGNPAP